MSKTITFTKRLRYGKQVFEVEERANSHHVRATEYAINGKVMRVWSRTFYFEGDHADPTTNLYHVINYYQLNHNFG